MSTKEEALEYIKSLAEGKFITKEELITAFNSGSGEKTDEVLTKKIGIAEILYYIGGAVVFLGIAILLAQNWPTLGFGSKIISTLGVGIGSYFTGLLFNRNKDTEAVGSAFFLISALVIPIGLGVVFENAGFVVNSYGLQSLISGILLGMYLLSFFVLRKNIFVLFSILFGTWFFFSITSLMIGGNPIFNDWKFYAYRILVVGLTYILLGYSFSRNERVPLSGFLYSFGIFGFLSAALALGGWKPNQNFFWELIYPGLVFGALFISVYIKSKAFLTWGTLFLMAYIIKITSEYFSDSLGWPLALVIAGFAMIGAGYLSIFLKKKYLSNS